jgi:hypothetical protein
MGPYYRPFIRSSQEISGVAVGEKKPRGLREDLLNVPVLISPQTITLIGTILGSAAVSANPPFEILVAMMVSEKRMKTPSDLTIPSDTS